MRDPSGYRGCFPPRLSEALNASARPSGDGLGTARRGPVVSSPSLANTVSRTLLRMARDTGAGDVERHSGGVSVLVATA